VVAAGPGDTAGFAVGDRAGAAWLRSTDGTCRYCARGTENLCPASAYTGWDADGGYAEYLTVPAAYAHPLPAGYSDAELAPLLCAGIIGYRALRRAALPPGGRLGLYGFGGSAHLAAQVALAEGATVSVMTRGEKARELARSLGAAFVGGASDMPPEPLDAAILFAPVGDLVLPALAALDRGGTLAIAGIYRHTAAVVRAPPVPGAAAAQRHLQHPRGRARVPRLRRVAPPVGHYARVPARRRRPRPGRPEGRPLRRRRRACPLERALCR
jgi:propanol-preferring alcohol dehydrogenase